MAISKELDCITRDKWTIRQLIEDLSMLEDQDLKVEISVDGGKTHKPISLELWKWQEESCLLVYCGND